MTMYLIGCSVALICCIVDAVFVYKEEEAYISIKDLFQLLLVCSFSWIAVLLYLLYICVERIEWSKVGMWLRRIGDIKIIDWRKKKDDYGTSQDYMEP